MEVNDGCESSQIRFTSFTSHCCVDDIIRFGICIVTGYGKQIDQLGVLTMRIAKLHKPFALRWPKQVHFWTGVVRKRDRKIWWVTTTKYPPFLSPIFRSGDVCQKGHFFNKAVQKGCLFTLSHQGLGGLTIQKSFLWENGASYPHFGLRGLAIYPIGMCKRALFHQYVVAVQCSCQCQ